MNQLNKSPVWGVWCTVEGGALGPRAGWLKAAKGEYRLFDTEAEALAEVERLRARKMYSPAVFTYTAKAYIPRSKYAWGRF